MIHSTTILSGILKDLRYSFRTLWQRPGFTAVVVLTLALGIGSSVAIFSVANAVLLRPLPYEDPERLVLIWNRMANASRPNAPVSGPDFLDYKLQTKMFEGFAGAFAVEGTLTGERADQVMVGWSTLNFFQILGVRPFLGRNFEPADGTTIDPKQMMDPSYEPPPGALLLSHRMWQRSFGADPKVLGQTLQLDGQECLIVGVLPADFDLYLPAYAGMPTDIDAWRVIPIDLATNPRDAEWLTVVARLKAEVTPEQAQAEMDALAARFREQFQHHKSVGMEIVVNPLHRDVVEHVRPLLFALLGAVAFVWLIACANVANLLLVRAKEREREVAVRAALGGGRGRIISQMLTESCVLAAGGGALGAALAWAGIRLLVAVRPAEVPRIDDVTIDATVLLFTAGLSLLAAFVFGAAPALKLAKPNLVGALVDRGGGSGGAGGNTLRTALVVSEVALTLVLLIGAGLMVRSFGNLQRVDPGFHSENVLTFTVPLPFFKYRDPEMRADFFDRLRERAAALPGVRQVGGASPLPLSGGDQYWILAYGREGATEEEWATNRADYRVALPGYSEAMGIELVAGRALAEADNQPNARQVIVIDEKLARQTWPEGDAVGKGMQIVRFNTDTFQMDRESVQVVGVVRHVRSESLTADGRGALYFPYRFFPWWPMSLTVQSETDPLTLVGAIREEVRAIDPDVPIADVRPMGDYVNGAMATARFTLTLVGVFSLMSLVLASIGLFGVMSYSVRQRFQEIGVRMAFGAGARSILRLIVGHGAALSLSGVAVGVAVSLAVTRWVSSLLFGVAPTDSVTFVGVALLLVGVTLVASYIPARRATRIDPVQALRGEARPAME